MADTMTKSPMKNVYQTQHTASSAAGGKKNENSHPPDKENGGKNQPKTTGAAGNKSKTSTRKTSIGSINPQIDLTQSQNINKEVILVLKELNENLNAQNKRIEKQDEKIEKISQSIDSLYDNDPGQAGEWPYDYDYEDCYYGDINSDISSQTVDNDSSVEPPLKKQKTGECSIFKSLGEKFQQSESVDAEINDDLASFVNNAFRSGISDEKQSELMKDIHRPSNCESLVKTRVNQGIWRLLKVHTQTDDSKLQSVQNYFVKAAVNITKLLDKRGDILDSQDIELGSNAIALLGHANKMLNTRRKEMHKADLDPKYHYLASSSLPFTDLLYGEDCDVNKNVREINDMNRIGRSIGRGFTQRGSANFRGRRSFRRGGRGRGRWPRFDNQAVPKKQRVAPKKY